jgi:hypothetical protein
LVNLSGADEWSIIYEIEPLNVAVSTGEKNGQPNRN